MFKKLSADQKKQLVKLVFGAVTSVAIGKIIKLERRIEEHIDQKIEDHFSEDTQIEPPQAG